LTTLGALEVYRLLRPIDCQTCITLHYIHSIHKQNAQLTQRGRAMFRAIAKSLIVTRGHLQRHVRIEH